MLILAKIKSKIYYGTILHHDMLQYGSHIAPKFLALEVPLRNPHCALVRWVLCANLAIDIGPASPNGFKRLQLEYSSWYNSKIRLR